MKRILTHTGAVAVIALMSAPAFAVESVSPEEAYDAKTQLGSSSDYAQYESRKQIGETAEGTFERQPQGSVGFDRHYQIYGDNQAEMIEPGLSGEQRGEPELGS